MERPTEAWNLSRSPGRIQVGCSTSSCAPYTDVSGPCHAEFQPAAWVAASLSMRGPKPAIHGRGRGGDEAARVVEVDKVVVPSDTLPAQQKR